MLSLDVGCGCNEMFPFSQYYGNVNVDIRKPSRKIPNFVLCDAHYLPFNINTFDRVFMFEVLEHLASPLRTLKEIRKILKVKGKLILSTPSGFHILKIARFVKRGFYSPHNDHIAVWNNPELNNLLARAGFSNISLSFANRKKGIGRGLREKIILFLCPISVLRCSSLIGVAQKEKEKWK